MVSYSSINQKLVFSWELVAIVCPRTHHRKFDFEIQNAWWLFKKAVEHIEETVTVKEMVT